MSIVNICSFLSDLLFCCLLHLPSYCELLTRLETIVFAVASRSVILEGRSGVLLTTPAGTNLRLRAGIIVQSRGLTTKRAWGALTCKNALACTTPII